MHKAIYASVVALTLSVTPDSAWAEPDGSLRFLERGKEVATLSLAEIRKDLAPKPLQVFEPHEGKTVSYTAVPARAVFEKIFGKQWRQKEEVLFTCSDGYQPSIPVKYFVESNAYFAFERVGQQYFTLKNKDQNEALVGLGPFYLVWDNLKDRKIRQKGPSVWPYQIVSVDLVRFKDRFPKLAPAPDASPKVLAGFLHFRTQCMNCHTINGEGGKKARELNYPVNVSEHRDESWLQRFLDNPSKLVPGIKMAPFNKLEPYRPRAIRETVAYLVHMKGRKQKPDEAAPAAAQ